MQHPLRFIRLARDHAGLAGRVLIIGLLAIFLPAGTLYAAGQQSAPQKPGILVQVTPSSRNVDQGQATSYSAAVSSTGGFAGTVLLAVAGLPAGATSNFSPSSVKLTAGSTAQLSVNVSTASSTAAGDYELTLTGQSGAVQSAAVKTQLRVKAPLRVFGLSGRRVRPARAGHEPLHGPGIHQPGQGHRRRQPDGLDHGRGPHGEGDRGQPALHGAGLCRGAVQRALSPDGSVRQQLALTTWRSIRPMAADRHARHSSPAGRLQGCSPPVGLLGIRAGKLTCTPHDPCCAAPESPEPPPPLPPRSACWPAEARPTPIGPPPAQVPAPQPQARCSVSVDALVAGDSNRTSLVPGGTRGRHPPDQQPQRVRGNAVLGGRQRGGHGRCRACRMPHHGGFLHGPGRPARTRRHHPGELFGVCHPAGCGEHVRPITVRLPGRDLQGSRHCGGTTMNHRDTRQAGSRIRSRVAVILAGAALLSWAGPGANAFWTATSNGGSASASADAVGAGATPTATVSGGSVTLAWNAEHHPGRPPRQQLHGGALCPARRPQDSRRRNLRGHRDRWARLHRRVPILRDMLAGAQGARCSELFPAQHPDLRCIQRVPVLGRNLRLHPPHRSSHGRGLELERRGNRLHGLRSHRAHRRPAHQGNLGKPRTRRRRPAHRRQQVGRHGSPTQQQDATTGRNNSCARDHWSRAQLRVLADES